MVLSLLEGYLQGFGSSGLAFWGSGFGKQPCLSVETDGRIRVQLGDGRFEVPGAKSCRSLSIHTYIHTYRPTGRQASRTYIHKYTCMYRQTMTDIRVRAFMCAYVYI